jgi:large subunit ribosomal protein L15
MPHRLRKVRKQRGSRTHGWGRVGQHRGVGMRGGHGKAGRKKHKWTYVVKYEPNYFGKHGFQRAWAPQPTTMNVGEVDERVPQLLAAGIATQTADEISIDLDQLKVEKLLGSGEVYHPLQLRVKTWSRGAQRKIEQAGGMLTTTTATEEKESRA